MGHPDKHEVVFSNSIAILKQIHAQLNAGASGFAAGDLGSRSRCL
jgi:hypothetical protein